MVERREIQLFLTRHGIFREDEAGPLVVENDPLGVRGFFLGGCVATGIGKISGRKRSEPAHTHVGGKHMGWICFQNPSDLDNKQLRVHQIIHLVTGEGHDYKWREAMKKAGQQLPSNLRSESCVTTYDCV